MEKIKEYFTSKIKIHQLPTCHYINEAKLELTMLLDTQRCSQITYNIMKYSPQKSIPYYSFTVIHVSKLQY